MNTRTAILGLLLLSTTLAVRGAARVREQLQKGIYEQEINNNLQAASASFESLLRELEPERIIAANALSRLAEIQQKLGKTNEAHASRLRLLRDFSDQTNLVAAAIRADPTTKAAGMPSQEQSQESKQIKARAQSILDQLKAETGTKRRAFAAQVGTPEIRQSMQTVDKLQLEITSLLDLGPNHPEMQKAQAKLKQAESQMDNRIDAMVQVLDQDPALLQILVSTKEPESEEDKELEQIRTLIKESPDRVDDRRSAFLGKAAAGGRIKVVKLLLDNGADPNLISEANTTPLFMAVDAGRRDAVELLVRKGANVNKIITGNSFSTALGMAAANGYTSIVQYLIDNGAEVNAGVVPPLILAIKQKRVLSAKLLLEKGANPNIRAGDDHSPLTVALQLEWKEMVKQLLALQVELNTSHAELGIKTDIPTQIRGLNTYLPKRTTPLGIAAATGNLELLDILLQAGANPKGHTNSMPPLMFGLNFPGLPELLVKQGADPNARILGGFRILDWYSRALTPTTNQLKTLLQIGANPLLKDDQNEIVVHHATAQNGFVLVQWMVEHHADVNSQYSKGDTLLHMAIRNNDEGMAKLLVDGGAELNLKNNDGLTPLDLAVKETFVHPHHWGDSDIPIVNPNRKIIDLIRAKGGQISESICFISGSFQPKYTRWPNGTEMDLITALRSVGISDKLTAITVKRGGQSIKIDRTELIAKNEKFPLMTWDEIIAQPPVAQ